MCYVGGAGLGRFTLFNVDVCCRVWIGIGDMTRCVMWGCRVGKVYSTHCVTWGMQGWESLHYSKLMSDVWLG